MATKENPPSVNDIEMPALLGMFNGTVQDTTPAVKEAPPEVIALVQWLFDNSKKYTASFRGTDEYHGKTGEAAAIAFENDVKNAGKQTTPPTTVRANRDGIVVSVRAVNKIGRKAGSADNGTSENAENGNDAS
jgi:hypothetical protein